MMNIAPGADPLRRAALTLHALPEPDRAWLLRALPARQRESVAPLLDELQTLGIPVDASLAKQLDAVPAAGTAAPAAAWPHALDAGSVLALGRVLAGEPAGMTQALLSMHAWAWTPSMLAGMEPGRRCAVDASLPGRAVSPRLAEAILHALRARLAQARQDPPAVAAPPWQKARAVLAHIVGTP
jgi:hypothetical protein